MITTNGTQVLSSVVPVSTIPLAFNEGRGGISTGVYFLIPEASFKCYGGFVPIHPASKEVGILD